MGSTSYKAYVPMPMATTTRNLSTMVQRRRTNAPGQHPLEHNTLRIAQYHHTQIKQQTIQTYTKFLNHKQTKDTKYVHPPRKITNLTLSIQECNPDKDIQTTKPTIQIQASEANIYDFRGHYMATLTIERLQWLWDQFSHNSHTHLTHEIQPPPQNFETEVLRLIQRYITILRKKKPKTILPNNLHHTLHPTITKTL